VTTRKDVEESFAQARHRAETGQIVVVRTDGQQIILPALSKGSASPDMIARIEQIVPSATKRRIAVIAETGWASTPSPMLQQANAAIPFFGMLMGLACIGHAVWVFSGTGDSLSAGCRAADALIVDSAVITGLPMEWKAQARQVMRNPQIAIHDRETYRLRIED
jgi:hypothetical protein